MFILVNRPLAWEPPWLLRLPWQKMRRTPSTQRTPSCRPGDWAWDGWTRGVGHFLLCYSCPSMGWESQCWYLKARQNKSKHVSFLTFGQMIDGQSWWLRVPFIWILLLEILAWTDCQTIDHQGFWVVYVYWTHCAAKAFALTFVSETWWQGVRDTLFWSEFNDYCTSIIIIMICIIMFIIIIIMLIFIVIINHRRYHHHHHHHHHSVVCTLFMFCLFVASCITVNHCLIN